MEELQLQQIKYFSDLALEYGHVSNLFWNFHIIIGAGALGWSISSRNWKTGLSPFSAGIFAIAFITFALINLYCQGILYERMNDAIGAASTLWERYKIDGVEIGKALTRIGDEHWPSRAQAGYVCGNLFSEGRIWVFGIDVVLALISAGLLSRLGRKPQADA